MSLRNKSFFKIIRYGMFKLKTGVYKTTAIITFLSVIERFMGFLYRIILSRTIGSEGMGLYQIALSLFAVLVTAASSGIPVTLTRIITKYKAQKNVKGESGAFSAAVISTLAFCVPVSLLLFFFAAKFDFLFSDERCEEIFVILIFGLSFTSVYAVIRGSFIGNGRFMAYSLIELIEEAVMIGAGTLLVLFASDILSGAKRAAFAVVISYITSFSIAFIYFFITGGKFSSPNGEFKPLISSALPITATRTSSSFVNSIVAVIFPARLIASGLSKAEAMSEYGIVSGMAMPVLTIPATIIGSIAIVLVPKLSECYYKNEHEKLSLNIEKAIKSAVLIACFIIPFLYVFGRDSGLLLFSSAKSGEIIKNSAIVLLPSSIAMMTASALNSLQMEKYTLFSFIAGAAVTLALAYLLPPLMGSYALIVGMGASQLICSVINLYLLNKKCKYKPRYLKHLLLSVLCIIPASIVGNKAYGLFNGLFSCALAIVFTSLIMTVLLAGLYFLLGLTSFLTKRRILNKKN